jgi:hypothetical protein
VAYHQISKIFEKRFLTLVFSHSPRDKYPCYVGPCHYGMVRPQDADGGDTLQVWKVAANIMNEQSRTDDKGWSSNLVVRRGAVRLIMGTTLKS